MLHFKSLKACTALVNYMTIKLDQIIPNRRKLRDTEHWKIKKTTQRDTVKRSILLKSDTVNTKMSKKATKQPQHCSSENKISQRMRYK